VHPDVRHGICSDAKQSKKRTVYLNGLVFVAVFIFMRPLITLIYVFVEHSKAVKGEAGSASGYATVETWAGALLSGGKSSTAESLCTEIYVARMILIPVSMLGCVQLFLAIWFRVAGGSQEKHARNADLVGDANLQWKD
jgi:hypothetical protein